MQRYVYTADGKTLLRVEEAKPVCNQDFCDECGDCLACYGEERCWDGAYDRGSHLWIVYEKPDPASACPVEEAIEDAIE